VSSYKWIVSSAVHAIQAEQIAEHGGLEGIRDINLLESALVRPQNLLKYGSPDISELAAAYGYGLVKNHPFNDGNKRVAFVVTELFLILNGYKLLANDEGCVLIMLKLASGDITEKEFASWIRSNLKQIK